MSPVRTAESIDIAFGLWTLVGPRKHVLVGGADAPWKGAILREKWALGEVFVVTHELNLW